MSDNFFFLKSCSLSDNVEKFGTDWQAADDNLAHALCVLWITKATNTHSECVMLIAFPRQEWLRERASVSRLYVHCLSCYLFVPFHLHSPVGTVAGVLHCASC